MKIIGHRGARGLAPENTLVSFKKALEYNVNEIEFDVRVTKDKIVVIHHNAHLVDPDGQNHLISKTDFSILRQHKKDLITLDETLDFIDKKVSSYIEIKRGVDVQPIVNVLKNRIESGLKPADFKLASFDLKILLDCRRALPEAVLIVNENWSGVRATSRGRKLGTRYISMNQRWLWFGFIKSVSRSGWMLYAFTLNNQGKAQRWKKYGLHAVITDFPDRFRL